MSLVSNCTCGVTGVNGVQCASDHVVSLVFNCSVTGVIGAKERQGASEVSHVNERNL